MTLHQNIHPSYENGKPRKWAQISAQFNDEKTGACVLLQLCDQNGDDVTICIHYGDIKNAQEFVDMLKAAILSIPWIVEEKKQNPAGFAVPPWGKDA